jgi:hypothetical protein
MARFLLQHRHEPRDCGVVFASFKGHDSPLRHEAALASCTFGAHEIWWLVDADTPADALGQLPFYVAQRATATQVDWVDVP